MGLAASVRFVNCFSMSVLFVSVIPMKMGQASPVLWDWQPVSVLSIVFQCLFFKVCHSHENGNPFLILI
jgi:hypothetical protein